SAATPALRCRRTATHAPRPRSVFPATPDAPGLPGNRLVPPRAARRVRRPAARLSRARRAGPPNAARQHPPAADSHPRKPAPLVTMPPCPFPSPVRTPRSRRAVVPPAPARRGHRQPHAPEHSLPRRAPHNLAAPGSGHRRERALSVARNACPPRRPGAHQRAGCLLLLPLLLAFGLLHHSEVQLALVVLLHVEHLVVEECRRLSVKEDPGPALSAEYLVLLLRCADDRERELGFLLALVLHREAQS